MFDLINQFFVFYSRAVDACSETHLCNINFAFFICLQCPFFVLLSMIDRSMGEDKREREREITFRYAYMYGGRVCDCVQYQTMNYSFCIYWFCLLSCLQPVDSHILNWAWNKVQNLIHPSNVRREFDCGKSDIPPILPAKFDSARVTGGLSAAPHSFPWIVNVINVKSLKSCGGAIINPNTILTGTTTTHIFLI